MFFQKVSYYLIKLMKVVIGNYTFLHISSSGVPAYWSGYFSTRPFMKKLSRELASSLRASEILFTWAYNLALRMENKAMVKTFEANYMTLIKARTNLALFQHHDAITGTGEIRICPKNVGSVGFKIILTVYSFFKKRTL